MTTINHSAIGIRPGIETDAHRLAALSIQVWLDTYAKEGVSEAIAQYVISTFNPARFAALSQAPGTSLWVAQAQAHLVGYALLRKGPDHVLDAYRDTELCTLYVQAPSSEEAWARNCSASHWTKQLIVCGSRSIRGIDAR